MLKAGTPLQKAFTRYGDDFDEIVAWYLEHGYVYSSPELFVLACLLPVEQIKKIKKSLDNDCWFVGFVAGDMKRLFQIMPEKKEFVIFERWGKKKQKIYKLDDIRRRIENGIT